MRVCRYVSHLVPGGSERSTWQRAARLRSSRAAGRAAGSSPLLSFLSRAHIHRNTHLLLPGPRFSLEKDAPQSKAATWLSSCVRQTNAGVSPGRARKPPPRPPPAPQRPGTQSWAASLLGTCGWNIASQRLERVCAVMWGVWKVESRSHSEEQQQEAPYSELCLLRLSPLDCCCATGASPPGGDKITLLTERRKPGFSLTSVWWPESASSLQQSRPQVWRLGKSYHIYLQR